VKRFTLGLAAAPGVVNLEKCDYDTQIDTLAAVVACLVSLSLLLPSEAFQPPSVVSLKTIGTKSLSY
jgi:hypothetical protein